MDCTYATSSSLFDSSVIVEQTTNRRYILKANDLIPVYTLTRPMLSSTYLDKKVWMEGGGGGGGGGRQRNENKNKYI